MATYPNRRYYKPKQASSCYLFFFGDNGCSQTFIQRWHGAVEIRLCTTIDPLLQWSQTFFCQMYPCLLLLTNLTIYPLILANCFSFSAGFLPSFHTLFIATHGVKVSQLSQYVDAFFKIVISVFQITWASPKSFHTTPANCRRTLGVSTPGWELLL